MIYLRLAVGFRGLRLGGTITLNARANALPVSSTSSAFAVSTNRAACSGSSGGFLAMLTSLTPEQLFDTSTACLSRLLGFGRRVLCRSRQALRDCRSENQTPLGNDEGVACRSAGKRLSCRV